MRDALPQKIHTMLRQSRFKKHVEHEHPTRHGQSKHYPRMPQIPLARCERSGVDLAEALTRRQSCREYSTTTFPTAEAIGTMLHLAVSSRQDGKRQHPSGGALYPIETYLVVRKANGLEAGAYHYRPDTHALEFLWPLLPTGNEVQEPKNAPLSDTAPVLLVLTSLWGRNAGKYHEFGFELALLEAGHIGQNIVLATAACGLDSCPLGGFDDGTLTQLFDLDPHTEQPVYAIAMGVRGD